MKTNIRSLLLAILMLGLSAYCISMAITSLDAQKAGWAAILVDILIPGSVAAALLTLCFCGTQPARRRTVAFSTSLAFCLFLAELVLQLRSGTPRLRNPPEVKPPSMAEALEDFQRRGIKAFPRYSPVMFGGMTSRPGVTIPQPDFIPLAGISNVTIVHDDESGQWNNFISDEHGFNNPLGSHQEKSDLVVLLGDSFTAGSGVGRDSNIASVLARGGRNVLNLGVIGMGPLAELATLREYGVALKPKDVVWIYYEGNDLSGLDEELRGPLAAYLDDSHSQGLRERQGEVDAFLAPLLGLYSRQERDRHWMSQAAKLSSLRHHLRTLLGSESVVAGAGNPRMLCRVLDHAIQTAADHGARFSFVYLPTSARFHPSKSVRRVCDTTHDPTRELVLSHLRQLGVKALDMVEEMRTAKEPESFYPMFPPSGHFNALGYDLVGTRIGAILSNNK